MIATWMVRMVAASLLIGAGAWLFERALAVRGLPRRGAWVVGLLAVIASPFVALAIPSLPGAAGAAGVLLNDGVVRIAGDTVARTMPVLETGRAHGGVPGVLWLSATLASALVYAAGWWRLRLARRAWRRRCVAGASVLVSPGAGPAAVGVLQPAIVVPEWLLTERESVQRLIVLHETEHLAAGDHLVLALAPLAIVLLPWNAPLWWMVRRLRLAIELDCDGRVLARGVEPSEYGSLLLDVAGRRGVGSLSIAMASPRSGLERRIEALGGVLPGSGRGRIAASIIAGLACAAVACGVAPTAPIDRGTGDELQAVSNGGAAALVRRFGGAGTRWTIDGAPATATDVDILPEGGIAMVRVEERSSPDPEQSSSAVGLSRTVHVLTPAYIAANPGLRADREVNARQGLLAMRALLDEPGVEIVIDGRRAEAAEARSLADGDIAKVEITRRRSGTDVASAIHIETMVPRGD